MFATIEKDTFGQVSALSSRPCDITDLIKRTKQYGAILESVPCGTTLYCELTAKGRPASQVKCADSDLELTGLAIASLPLNTQLQYIADLYTLWGIPFAPWMELRNGWRAPEIMQHFINMGYEGAVLKDGNVLNWRRLKPECTVDLVVLGSKEGNGKHFGKVGSLRCGFWNGVGFDEVAYVGGMTDDDRDFITANLTKLIVEHAVVEVKYQEVASGGRLRHPRFVRFRDDKSWQECTEDQLDG